MHLKRIGLILLFFSSITNAQRLDNLGKAKPITITGGISANSVFYNGSANRDDFTYFLNGNINTNLYGLYNIPVSFSYTNQQFNFNEPSFKINRLSLHPSYKWVTAHIGDVAMSFSPYTLNAHQFTGLGFDLAPNSPFKISAMYGRLVRDREYNANEPEALPSYKRMGYGIKTSYEKPEYKIGVTLFNAKDDLNSIRSEIPDDLNITPKENLVISLEGRIRFLKKGNLDVEYASSALTNDIRSETSDGNHILSNIFNNRTSTSYHNAFNIDLSYAVGKGTLGVGYERIDPQYQTLGAYFFNNDLENITVKLNQTLFNNKLNVNVNSGLQRDDLDNQKQSKLSRLVASVNLNLRANEKLTLNGSYSNFRAQTQIKNQFDFINEVEQFDNLDTLNFTQISQNIHLNANYNLSQNKEKRQSLNFNLSYQSTDEKQDAFLIEVDKNNSKFFNGNIGYTISFSEQSLSLTGAFNSTYNTIDTIETIIAGPTLAIVKQFFNKKLRTSFSGAYNTTSTDGTKMGDILNFRLGGNYRYKENHNFNLNLVQLFRNSNTQNTINDFTTTFGYTYTFSSRKKKRRTAEIIEDEKRKKPPTSEKLMKVNYGKYHFEGPPSEILKQLDSLHSSLDVKYLDKKTVDNYNNSFSTIKNTDINDTKAFKESIKTYLEHRNELLKRLESYQTKVKEVLGNLGNDLRTAHDKFEKEYIEARGELNKTLQSDANYDQKKKKLEEAKKIFMHHSWIVNQLQRPEKDILKDLHIYKGSMLNEVEQMSSKGKNDEEIALQIKLALIAFYDEQASKYASEKDINILNYD